MSVRPPWLRPRGGTMRVAGGASVRLDAPFNYNEGADDLSTSPSTVRRPDSTGLCRVQKGRRRRGEQLVVAIFTFRTNERLTRRRIKEEVVRKARHVLKGAILAA